MSYDGFPHPPYPFTLLNGKKEKGEKGRVGGAGEKKKKEKRKAARVGEGAKNTS